MSTIGERIKLIMEHYGMNTRSFAEYIGFERNQNSRVVKKINGQENPSYDMLMLIIEKCDEIDVEWLMTGKGKMLKSSEGDVDFYKNHVASLLKIIENLTDKGENVAPLESMRHVRC